MTTYFYRSSNRLSRLSDLQKELQVAVNQPPQKGNIVRWHYTHDSMNWFHEQKCVVQTYDINYGAEARHEDGPYADSHTDYSDWKVNEQSVAILYPSATLVNDIERTLYVTCSLILPSTYMLIQKARHPNVVAPWDVVKPSDEHGDETKNIVSLQRVIKVYHKYNKSLEIKHYQIIQCMYMRPMGCGPGYTPPLK